MQVFSLDRDRATAELRRSARALLRRDRRVELVVLFGSLAKGVAVPGSDADLLVVLREHPLPRWFDRISELALDASLPVELFPFTWEEVQSGGSRAGLIHTILREGLPLAGRALALRRWRLLRESTLSAAASTAIK